MADETTNGQANFSEVLEVLVDPRSFEEGLALLTQKYNDWVTKLGENAPAVTGFGTGATAGLKEAQEQFKAFAEKAKSTFDQVGVTLEALTNRVIHLQDVMNAAVLGTVQKDGEGQKQRVDNAVSANGQIIESYKNLYAKEQELLAGRKHDIPTHETDATAATQASSNIVQGIQEATRLLSTLKAEYASLAETPVQVGGEANNEQLSRRLALEQEVKLATEEIAALTKLLSAEDAGLNRTDAQRLELLAKTRNMLTEVLDLQLRISAAAASTVTGGAALPRPGVVEPALVEEGRVPAVESPLAGVTGFAELTAAAGEFAAKIDTLLSSVTAAQPEVKPIEPVTPPETPAKFKAPPEKVINVEGIGDTHPLPSVAERTRFALGTIGVGAREQPNIVPGAVNTGEIVQGVEELKARLQATFKSTGQSINDLLSNVNQSVLRTLEQARIKQDEQLDKLQGKLSTIKLKGDLPGQINDIKAQLETVLAKQEKLRTTTPEGTAEIVRKPDGTQDFDAKAQYLRLLNEELSLRGKLDSAFSKLDADQQLQIGFQEKLNALVDKNIDRQTRVSERLSGASAEERLERIDSSKNLQIARIAENQPVEGESGKEAKAREGRLKEALVELDRLETERVSIEREQVRAANEVTAQLEAQQTLLQRAAALRERMAVATAEGADAKRGVLQGQLDSKQQRLKELEPALSETAPESSSAYTDRNAAIKEFIDLQGRVLGLTLEIKKIDIDHNAILEESATIMQRLAALQDKLDVAAAGDNLKAKRDVLKGQFDQREQGITALQPSVGLDKSDLNTKDATDLTQNEKQYLALKSDQLKIASDIATVDRQIEAEEDRITAAIEKQNSLKRNSASLALDGKPAEQAALWSQRLKEVEADLEKLNQLRLVSPTGRLSEDEEVKAAKLTAQQSEAKAKLKSATDQQITLQQRFNAEIERGVQIEYKLATVNVGDSLQAQLGKVQERMVALRSEIDKLRDSANLSATNTNPTPLDITTLQQVTEKENEFTQLRAKQISLVQKLGEEHKGVFANIIGELSSALTVALKYSLAYGAIFQAFRAVREVAEAPFAALKEGVEYASDLENKSYDLGAVLAANVRFSNDFGTNFARAHEVGVQAMQRLQDKAVELRIPLDAAVGSYRALIEAKGVDFVKSPQQLADLAAELQVIAKSRPKDSKFSAQQLQGDLPKLFSEDVQQGNAWLQILQKSVGEWQRMLASAKENHDLFEQMAPSLAPFLTAAQQSSGDLTNITEQFTLLKNRIEAIGAAETFQKVKDFFNFLTAWMQTHSSELSGVLSGIAFHVTDLISQFAKLGEIPVLGWALREGLLGIVAILATISLTVSNAIDDIVTGSKILVADLKGDIAEGNKEADALDRRMEERRARFDALLSNTSDSLFGDRPKRTGLDAEVAGEAGTRGTTPGQSDVQRGNQAELDKADADYKKSVDALRSRSAEAKANVKALKDEHVIQYQEAAERIAAIDKKEIQSLADFAKQHAAETAAAMGKIKEAGQPGAAGDFTSRVGSAGSSVGLKGDIPKIVAPFDEQKAEYKALADEAKNAASQAREDVQDLIQDGKIGYAEAATRIASINKTELTELDRLGQKVLTQAAATRAKLKADNSTNQAERDAAVAQFDSRNLIGTAKEVLDTHAQAVRTGVTTERTAKREEARSEVSDQGEKKDTAIAAIEAEKQFRINAAREESAAGRISEAELHQAINDALIAEKARIDEVMAAYKKGLSEIKGLDKTTRGRLESAADVFVTNKDRSEGAEQTANTDAAARAEFASQKALAESELSFLKQESARKIQLAKDAGASEVEVADLTAAARQQAFVKEQGILQEEIATFSGLTNTKKLLLTKFNQAETLEGWQLQADAVKRAGASIRDSLRDLENSYKQAAESQKLVLRSAEDSSSTTQRTRDVVLRLAQSYLDLGKAQQLHLQQLLNKAYDNNDYETIQKVTSALDRQKESVVQLTEQRDRARKRDTTGFDPTNARIVQQSEEKIHDSELVKDLKDQIQRTKDERSHLLASVDRNKPVIDASNANTGALRDLTAAIKAFSLPQPPAFEPRPAGAAQPTQEVKSSSEPQATQEIAVPQPAVAPATTVHIEVPAAIPSALRDIVAKVSQITGVSADLITAVMRQESSFNPNAVSPKGAQGLMQLMPGTAKEVTNPFDPTQNVLGGSKYLASLLEKFGGDLIKALAAYNAGPARVESGKPLPAETRNYLERILAAIVSSKLGSPSPSSTPLFAPTLPLAAQNLPTPPPFTTGNVSPHGFQIGAEVASLGQPPVIATPPVATAELTALQKLTAALQADSVSKLFASLQPSESTTAESTGSKIDTNVPSIVVGQGEQSPELQQRIDKLTETLNSLIATLKDVNTVQQSKKGFSFSDALDSVTGGAVTAFKKAKAAKDAEPEGASTAQDTANEGAAIVTGLKNIVGSIKAEISIYKQGAETGGTAGGIGALLSTGPLSDALSQIPIVGAFVKPVGQLISFVADAFTAGARKIAAEIQAQFENTTKQISEGILGTGAGLNALMAERDEATKRLFQQQSAFTPGRIALAAAIPITAIFGNGAMEALAKLLPPMTEKIEEMVRLQAQIFAQFENQLHSMQLQSDTLGQINSEWQSINQEVAKYIDAGGDAGKATQMLKLGIQKIERESAAELSQGYDAAVKDAIQLYDLTKSRADMEKSFKQQEFGLINADSEERTQAGAVSRGQQLEQLREDFQKNLDNINSEISLTTKKVAAESKLFDLAKNISDLHRQDEALQLASLQLQLQKYRDLMAVTTQISTGKVLPGKGDPKLVAQLESLDQQIASISSSLEIDITTNHQGRSGQDTATLQALLAQQKVLEAAVTKSAGGSLFGTGAAGVNLQAVEGALGALSDQAKFASAHPDTDTGGWGDAVKLLAYLNMLKDLTAGLSQQQSNLLNSTTLIGTGTTPATSSGQDLTLATLQKLLNAGLTGGQKVTSLTPPSAGTASFVSDMTAAVQSGSAVATSTGQISSLGTQAASAGTQLTNLAAAVQAVTGKLTGTVQPTVATKTGAAKEVTAVAATLPSSTTAPTPANHTPVTPVEQFITKLFSQHLPVPQPVDPAKTQTLEWITKGLKNFASQSFYIPLDGLSKRLESYMIALNARPAPAYTFSITVNGTGLEAKAIGQQIGASVAQEIQRQSRQTPRF